MSGAPIISGMHVVGDPGEDRDDEEEDHHVAWVEKTPL